MGNWIRRYGLLFGVCALAVGLSACASKGTEQVTTSATTEAKGSTAKGGVPVVNDPEGGKGLLVFVQAGCNACHMNPATGKDYPDLRGLYGKTVKLQDGREVVVDEEYIKRSIRDPNKEVVAGYQPSMPSYSHLSDEQVNQLIAYIRAMKDMKPEFVKEESGAQKP